MTLTMAPIGHQMKIHRITGKDEMKGRLANMGFVEGANVYLVNELNGNVIINIKETRVALDKTLSNRILVQESEDNV